MARKTRVLLLEPNKRARGNLRDVLRDMGCTVRQAEHRDQAQKLLAQNEPQILLASHAAIDSDLCTYARELAEQPAAVIVIYPRSTPNPEGEALSLGADGGFARPVSRDIFGLILGLGVRLANMRRRTLAAQHGVHQLEDRLERLGDVRPGQRFYHFEFFKHLLVVEIRRAKRYKYPLSVLLVELDPVELPTELEKARRELRAGVARAVSESIRDIDIPVWIGGERILIVLPHTPTKGAKRVARRVLRLLREGMYPVGGDLLDLTASIGLSGLDEEHRRSFSQLISEAQKAIDAARELGGNTIVARI